MGGFLRGGGEGAGREGRAGAGGRGEGGNDKGSAPSREEGPTLWWGMEGELFVGQEDILVDRGEVLS